MKYTTCLYAVAKKGNILYRYLMTKYEVIVENLKPMFERLGMVSVFSLK